MNATAEHGRDWELQQACGTLARGLARIALLALICASVVPSPAAPAGEPAGLITFNDDGAWCWFQDERALIHDGKLIIASVANGSHDPARRGDIEIVTYDMASGRASRSELYDRLEPDDHAVPALWLRNDDRLLAVFAKHGSEDHFYGRLTASPGDFTQWEPPTLFSPSASSRVTYANLHFLSAENAGRGRLYLFFRGLGGSFKPSFATSDNGGQTWTRGTVVINVPLAFRHRPYVKYASDGRDTIHLLYTDGHPRDFDNSVYHVFYRDGVLHRSDGQAIRGLDEGLSSPQEGACVFRGDKDNVAWVSDLHLSPEGRPVAVYSVQKNAAGLRSGDEQAGQDHRYRYASWDGNAWCDHEIAFAGTRLYVGEDDYTGNICLDPDRLNTVYISTNADPTNGAPLISATDHRRHFEIFRGLTADGGATWAWSPITRDSTADNLRPIVPKWDSDHCALLWFRGEYRSYRDYQAEIVGHVFPAATNVRSTP
ncbi:MAG: BNR-4 repeat-containing protein [Planctomycetes bacterium]|nr:BNR-4 repeat-containing protein [Planctomycetota bacterium]